MYTSDCPEQTERVSAQFHEKLTIIFTSSFQYSLLPIFIRFCQNPVTEVLSKLQNEHVPTCTYVDVLALNIK